MPHLGPLGLIVSVRVTQLTEYCRLIEINGDIMAVMEIEYKE